MKQRLLVLVLAALACGKTEGERRRDVARCSERSADALEIQLCLETEYAWKDADAGPASIARAAELDSLRRHEDDSIWAAGARQRRDEIRRCTEPDLARCLLVQFGWPEERAKAAADSVWHSGAVAHGRAVRACRQQREANVGSCLMLRYRWPHARALALEDSLVRERMR
jgi:hypothetical protein